MKLTIHMVAKVANGYEYFYTIFDDDGSVLAGNQTEYIGKEPPSEDDIKAWKTDRLERFAAELKEAVEPQPEIIEGSSVDRELVDLKAAIKKIVLGAVKANPEITEAEAAAVVTDRLGDTAGALTVGFIKLYVKEAFDRKLIAEETFAALADFIAATPLETLQELR